MKKLILACALLAAGPVFAQNSLTTTQDPPAGKSNESTPEPTNSLPRGAGTERPTQQPGSSLGQTMTTPPAGTATTAPPATR